MLCHLLFFLTASVYLCDAVSMTPPHQALVPRQLPDCQNLTQGLDADCWDVVPPGVGMESWLNTWNKTTRTCEPGEMWANCFMRLAGLGSNFSKPIRCDLIGPDVCPMPTVEDFENVNASVGYGVASIWGRPSNRSSRREFSKS